MDKNVIKIVLTFELIMQFLWPSLESLASYLTTLLCEEKQKSDTLADIDNYNFCYIQTDRETLRLYDRPSPEGQVGENKIIRE